MVVLCYKYWAPILLIRQIMRIRITYNDNSNTSRIVAIIGSRIMVRTIIILATITIRRMP